MAAAGGGQRYPLTWGTRRRTAREDFLPAPSNAAALAWIERWPDWPGPALALYGPAGCGKTHLASIWQAPKRRAGSDAERPGGGGAGGAAAARPGGPAGYRRMAGGARTPSSLDGGGAVPSASTGWLMRGGSLLVSCSRVSRRRAGR